MAFLHAFILFLFLVHIKIFLMIYLFYQLLPSIAVISGQLTAVFMALYTLALIVRRIFCRYHDHQIFSGRVSIRADSICLSRYHFLKNHTTVRLNL